MASDHLSNQGGDPDPRWATRAPRKQNGGRAPITIGLVNNMPDAALSATEAQFRQLVESSAGDRQVRLKLFSIPEVSRSEAARDYMQGRYASTEALSDSGVDALIVTGAEPLALTLEDEPYWESLTGLVDWAETNTVSTLWSCLAAHAAVQHLDGVRRQPLTRKLSGVFRVERTGRDALFIGANQPLLIPHSRQNGLSEQELEAKGYRVLTRSDIVGVDSFTRQGASLFLFLQGHPEYGPDSLMMEYRRDVRRFIRGERSRHPALPSGYFDGPTAQRLEILAQRTAADPRPANLLECARIIAASPPKDSWAGSTQRLYSNWIDLVEVGIKARLTA